MSYVNDGFENIELDYNADEENDINLAVHIKDCEFGYNKKVTVIKNLNLKVPKGKIFALLGPNGTGKTTLMRTILGRLTMKRGSIKVFGVTPGTKGFDIPGKGVGYMPQELALFDDFTIKEILKYYGTIYKMNEKHLNQRIDELIELLNLPKTGQYIHQLSGGQQRRVSIAITMIHKPKLIILDEPTVGVDSLLRAKIWKYLEDICNESGQTVLITTHYIEEARSAHSIAFMFGGTILRQANPHVLLKEYHCDTLEEVFLILCQQKLHKDSVFETKLNKDSIELPQLENITNENNTLITLGNNESELINYKHIKAMLWKYYILTKRKPAFLFLFYFLPYMILTAMHLAIGKSPRHMPIAIYNADINPVYSELFIDSITPDILKITEYKTNESAFQSIVDGINALSIVFPSNYSDEFYNRFSDPLNADEDEIRGSQLKIYQDLSNPAISLYIFREIYYTFTRVLHKMGDDIGLNIYGLTHPIDHSGVVYGKLEMNLNSHFAPGILLVVTHLLPLVISALHIINDRSNYTFERVFVAGIKPMEYFLAHIIQNIIIISIEVALMMLMAFYLYEYENIGSYFEIYIILLLQGLQGMSLGLFMALLFKEIASVAIIIIGSVLPFLTMSGIIWPTEAVPSYFYFIVELSPYTVPVNTMRSIMFRGWSYTHPSIIYGYAFSIGYVLVWGLIAVVVFHFEAFML